MRLEVEVERMLVVSDLHLGSPASQAGRSFPRFLDEMLHPDWALCINGDAVDLLQGTTARIAADLLPVLRRLEAFARGGGRILYTLGNHDLLLEHFLADLPIEVAPFLNVRSGDRRIRIEHGHLREPSYARFPGLYELGGRLGRLPLVASADTYRLWSASQRALDRRRRRQDRYPYHRAADELFERGFDAVVFGHTHLPELTHRGRGVMVNGGDWMHGGTYVRIDRGEITLGQTGVLAPVGIEAGAR